MIAIRPLSDDTKIMKNGAIIDEIRLQADPIKNRRRFFMILVSFESGRIAIKNRTVFHDFDVV